MARFAPAASLRRASTDQQQSSLAVGALLRQAAARWPTRIYIFGGREARALDRRHHDGHCRDRPSRVENLASSSMPRARPEGGVKQRARGRRSPSVRARHTGARTPPRHRQPMLHQSALAFSTRGMKRGGVAEALAGHRRRHFDYMTRFRCLPYASPLDSRDAARFDGPSMLQIRPISPCHEWRARRLFPRARQKRPYSFS